MNPNEPPAFTYEQFCDEVRRFDQIQMLTGIARTAIALPESVGDPRYQRTPPWTLAALVKASICNGNAFRSTDVKPNDIALRVPKTHATCRYSWMMPPARLRLGTLKSVGIVVRGRRRSAD